MFGYCAHSPLKSVGEPELIARITASEIDALVAAVPAGRPWWGTVRIAGEPRSVLARASDATPKGLLVLVRSTHALPTLAVAVSPQLLSDRLRRGSALIVGGVVPGVTSVAAPVRTPGGSLPLAVAVALPARLADEATLAAVTTGLLRSTAAIEADLGSTDAHESTQDRSLSDE